jgi:hypothetical protein
MELTKKQIIGIAVTIAAIVIAVLIYYFTIKDDSTKPETMITGMINDIYARQEAYDKSRPNF